MKQLILTPILILILGITACSPVREALENHTLGATLGTAITAVDAEPEELPAISPSQDVTLQQVQDAALQQAQDGAPEISSEPLPSMPIITEGHQGFTYRPGQVVAVLTEGFEEGDTLAVTLVHEDQGQIDTHFVSPVGPRGKIPIYFPVEIEEANIYPDGSYTLRVSGSDGTRKIYTFSLDYLNPAETAPFEGCGVYPEPVLDSIVFVWCTGYEPSMAPLDIRGLVNGEELFTDIVETIYSDGVALYILDIFGDDPAGKWTLEIGQNQFTFDVPGEIHE